MAEQQHRTRRMSTIPQYGKVNINGHVYYRTRITNDEGKRISVYGLTRKELFEKASKIEYQIDNYIYGLEPSVRD